MPRLSIYLSNYFFDLFIGLFAIFRPDVKVWVDTDSISYSFNENMGIDGVISLIKALRSNKKVETLALRCPEYDSCNMKFAEYCYKYVRSCKNMSIKCLFLFVRSCCLDIGENSGRLNSELDNSDGLFFPTSITSLMLRYKMSWKNCCQLCRQMQQIHCLQIPFQEDWKWQQTGLKQFQQNGSSWCYRFVSCPFEFNLSEKAGFFVSLSNVSEYFQDHRFRCRIAKTNSAWTDDEYCLNIWWNQNSNLLN